MRTFLKATVFSALIAGAALFGQAASAAPLVGNGSVSMAGGFAPVGGTGSDLSGATGLHFLPTGPGNVTVTSPGGTGSFSSLAAGTTGTIQDFSFAPFTPVAGFLTIGGFSFDLNTVGIQLQSATFLDLHGTATVNEAGFAATQATFDFSGQGGGLPATFSWSATAAVPEPMTIGVLGMGLAAFGFMRRRSSAKV